MSINFPEGSLEGLMMLIGRVPLSLFSLDPYNKQVIDWHERVLNGNEQHAFTCFTNMGCMFENVCPICIKKIDWQRREQEGLWLQNEHVTCFWREINQKNKTTNKTIIQKQKWTERWKRDGR